MRIQPLHPDNMSAEAKYVHDEITKLVTKSQGPVTMVNAEGALTGPFPPMLSFPEFGVPALSFIRTIDTHATLPKKLREVAILTVGSFFNARFELYAHEIMAEHFGFSKADVGLLATGNRPASLNESETIAFEIASVVLRGSVVPASTYAEAIRVLGKNGTAELIFLIGAYSLIAVVLNGFDVPSPE